MDRLTRTEKIRSSAEYQVPSTVKNDAKKADQIVGNDGWKHLIEIARPEGDLLAKVMTAHFELMESARKAPDVVLEKLRGIDAVIADGTYLLTDQYKEAKGNHMHGEDIFRFINSLGAKAVYYHSISHLTDRTHEELQKAMPARHIVSYDGTEVVF